MGIAITLRDFLESAGVAYEVVHHPHSSFSEDTAHKAQVSTEALAKSVVLEDEKGYVLAVIPADHRVGIGKLSQMLGRQLTLATEAELDTLFGDCDPGAVPPLGRAYGIETVWDDSLAELPDVYFEGGDHETLVHMATPAFMNLMGQARHALISLPR
jgi:Ala-tRNA(Pro) deacylase